MCVAGLNVSTQSCAHRWYELVRPCNTAHNLANCPEKLRLEGWETRNERCPWCDVDSQQPTCRTTHRLFGSTASSSSSIASAPTSPVIGGMRQQRSGSTGSLSSLSLSRASSVTSARGHFHRERNERLNMYLTMSPHELLPSAAKYYPEPPKEEISTSPEVGSVRPQNRRRQQSWRKSISMAKGMFGG